MKAIQQSTTLLGRKRLTNDTRAVFGLTSVQAFFVIILGIALLAYVIVVIFGVLQSSNVIPPLSATTVNESSFFNTTGDNLNNNTLPGFTNVVVITAINGSCASCAPIIAANFTVTAAGVVTNATATVWNNVNITYSFGFLSNFANQQNQILQNTSQGVSGFFANVSPVYSILAILVIILVLVVLVRVVSGSQSSGGRYVTPQL